MPSQLGDFGIVVAGSFVLRCVVIGGFGPLELLARDQAAESSGNKQDARIDTPSCPMTIVIRRGERRIWQTFRGFVRLLILDHSFGPGDAFPSKQTQVAEEKKRDHFAKAQKDEDGRR